MSMIEMQFRENQSGIEVLREYASIAWRRRWIMISTIVLTMVAAWAYCLLAPKLYRSETLILVEDQKIPESYVQGVVEGNLEQRIFVIQRQVTSQALLREAVKEFNLYPKLVKEYGIEAAIGAAADSIIVEMVGKELRGNFVGRSGIDAFTIAFQHEDPGIAMKATDWIASQFINVNLKAREQTAESTTEFLDDEVRMAKVELERREDEISRFKSAHVGELPQQMEANLRALDRLQTEINAVNESTQRLSDRQLLVQKAIQEYQRYGKTNAALYAGPVEPDPLFRRLNDLRERLSKLNAEFWDGYPEVLLTKDELQQVEKDLIARYGPDVLKPGERPLDPYLQDLKKQQSELGTELTLLTQRKRLLQTEQKDYEKRVGRAPELEQELLILERDYSNVKNSYTSLLEKRLNARVVENLEKRQKGGQFRILDSANYPRVPVSPNQRRVLLLGLIGGCAVGMGIVVMKERLNPQFRHPEDVEFMLGPQLLAVIPNFAVELAQMRRLGHLPSTHLPEGVPGQNSIRSQPRIGWRRLVGPNDSPSVRQEVNLVAKWWPNSIIGEQYRVAATRLTLLEHQRPSTVVAVTSAVQGEGKTTTVVNLGYTLARDLGKRTLLLECDFGRPMLHHYSDTQPRWGLADALVSDVPIEECLGGLGDVPCWIMPIGNFETNVYELLRTERFGRLLARCREEFEYILINTPPILPLATMNMLEQHADLMLLVVRASSTTHQVVKRALGSLRANKPLHVILNAVEGQSLPNYMSDSYYQKIASATQPTSSV